MLKIINRNHYQLHTSSRSWNGVLDLKNGRLFYYLGGKFIFFSTSNDPPSLVVSERFKDGEITYFQYQTLQRYGRCHFSQKWIIKNITFHTILHWGYFLNLDCWFLNKTWFFFSSKRKIDTNGLKKQIYIPTLLAPPVLICISSGVTHFSENSIFLN